MQVRPEITEWRRHIHKPEDYGLIMRTRKFSKEHPFWEVIVVLVVLTVFFTALALWLD
jgi:hypothetical protein